MIFYENKDLTSVTYGIIGHGTNCQLKMGSGVAKDIKFKFPKVYAEYSRLEKGKHLLTTIQPVEINDFLYVVNIFTQEFYGRNGKYTTSEIVSKSLTNFMDFCQMIDLPIYLPKIACGLGGCDWENEIKPIVENLSLMYNRDITICMDTISSSLIGGCGLKHINNITKNL